VIKALFYPLIEPFTWIYYCFFQTDKFKREFEIRSFSARIVPTLRLIFPAFLTAIVISTLFLLIFGNLSLSSSAFLLNTVWAVILGSSWGLLWGMTRGITWSILWGIIWGVMWGVTWNGSLITASYLAIGIVVGLVVGFEGKSNDFVLGIFAWSIIWIIPLYLEQGLTWVIHSLVLIRNFDIVFGIGILGSLVLIIVIGIVWGIVRSLMERGVEEHSIENTLKKIATFIQSGIVKGLPYKGANAGFIETIVNGLLVGFPVALLYGFALNFLTTNTRLSLYLTILWIIIGSLGFFMGVLSGLLAGLGTFLAFSLGIPLGITLGATFNVSGIIIAVIAFVYSCNLGLVFLRLLLYPISAISSYKAYILSRADPLQVFDFLHHSSLYWDERCIFPLPGLKKTLIIASKQNIDLALAEFVFIGNERPQQKSRARSALLEAAICNLEIREDLEDIALAFQLITKIFSPETMLSDPQWILAFTRFNEASRDAARFCIPVNWRTKRKALEDMVADLQSRYISSNRKLRLRLDKIGIKWELIAKNKLEEIDKTFDEKQILTDNPYTPGPVLELSNSRFVGRYDLVRTLEEALSKGIRRPTFLLNGERRMGKSSTLKQLPNLLGARYLPIYYDMQDRGLSSSAAEFLSAIAEEIYEVMRLRGMNARKLEYSALRKAFQRNEAAVYRSFDQWFKAVEQILVKNNRTLLLIFDEFEKLEEAGQSGYLDLWLLLDWFRHVIQNRLQLALLFSGVRTFGEMGTNWASYFVNVQTLKVSFLLPAEAHQLITKPIPSFPSEQVFSEGVVEEIIRVTGCHPFLVQAVCATLIDQLNAENCYKADLQHVTTAVNQVMESWWDTYFRDLWERTNLEQRMCLAALKEIGDGNLRQIAQQSNLDTEITYLALQALLYRDLVVTRNDDYRIAAPIFCLWVERNR
jgi:hypothetical protein